jgi:hypothetical protein
MQILAKSLEINISCWEAPKIENEDFLEYL